MNKILFVVIVFITLTLVACGGDSGVAAVSTLAAIPSEYTGKTNPFGADAADAGAQVFKSNCESCHGSLGRGDGPASVALDPKPKDLVEFQAVAGDDYLFWRINTGKDGTAMVAWKGILTDEQIWQVISFLHTLK